MGVRVDKPMNTEVNQKNVSTPGDDRCHEGRLIDIGEVSRRLGVSKNTLYDWCAFGRIPYIKLGGKFVRFDPAEIGRWLESKKVAVQNK